MDYYNTSTRTPSSAHTRRTLNIERLMDYMDESEAPSAMPVSDTSGRSSRSSPRVASRSPLLSKSRKSANHATGGSKNRRSSLRAASRSPLLSKGRKSANNATGGSKHRRSLKGSLKALLSPLTPSRRKKRTVLSSSINETRSEHQRRGSFGWKAPKKPHQSPKSAGGRRRYVMDRLAVKNQDEDEDIRSTDDDWKETPTSQKSSLSPTKSPRGELSKNSLIQRLSIRNLDDDEETASAKKPPSPPKEIRNRRKGGKRHNRKERESLHLKDVFPHKNLVDSEDDDIEDNEANTALDQWRSERKMACSDDHVSSRDYQGSSGSGALLDGSSSRNSMRGSRSSSIRLRSIFRSSNNNSSSDNVRYSIRRGDTGKSDPSLDLAKMIVDEMGDSDGEFEMRDSGNFDSKDF